MNFTGDVIFICCTGLGGGVEIAGMVLGANSMILGPDTGALFVLSTDGLFTFSE